MGQIYSGLARIRDRYAALVREKFPRIPRRVSGYNLDELLPENNFHVARALVGSEGTCANIVSATLNLTASPPFRVLTVLGFSDAFLAADAVPLALEHKPIGLEGFDHLLVEFMRRKGLALRDLDRLPAGVGFLLVEMGAWSAEEAHAKAESVARASQSWPSPPAAHICTPEEAASVWHVRESALGAMVFVPGEPDRWEGWEDAAVPPAKLGDYLRAITKLMAEYGYPQPALRPLRPGLRAHAHQLRLLDSKGNTKYFANSSIAPPMSCSPSADRSAASTATASRARRCCPKCSVPNSWRPSANSKGSGIRTTA